VTESVKLDRSLERPSGLLFDGALTLSLGVLQYEDGSHGSSLSQLQTCLIPTGLSSRLEAGTTLPGVAECQAEQVPWRIQSSVVLAHDDCDPGIFLTPVSCDPACPSPFLFYAPFLRFRGGAAPRITDASYDGVHSVCGMRL
jgi:hypothetical protein